MSLDQRQIWCQFLLCLWVGKADILETKNPTSTGALYGSPCCKDESVPIKRIGYERRRITFLDKLVFSKYWIKRNSSAYLLPTKWLLLDICHVRPGASREYSCESSRRHNEELSIHGYKGDWWFKGPLFLQLNDTQWPKQNGWRRWKGKRQPAHYNTCWQCLHWEEHYHSSFDRYNRKHNPRNLRLFQVKETLLNGTMFTGWKNGWMTINSVD